MLRHALSRLAFALVVFALASGPAHGAGKIVTIDQCGLLWEPPTTNTDGTTLDDLAGYRLYIGREPGIKKGPTPHATIPAPTPTPSPGMTVAWDCIGVQPGQNFATVTAFDTTGNEGPESNELPFVLDDVTPTAPMLRMK